MQFGTDVNFIGYPNASRQGNSFTFIESVGISSKSEHKDAAWEFVRQLMTREYLGAASEYTVHLFPARKDGLENAISCLTSTEDYTDDLGYGSAMHMRTLADGTELGAASQEDVDLYMKVLEDTKGRRYYDSALHTIVWEEIQAYLSEDKSAGETAKIIQNRATTYVNESR